MTSTSTSALRISQQTIQAAVFSACCSTHLILIVLMDGISAMGGIVALCTRHSGRTYLISDIETLYRDCQCQS